jgi:hypothetical protein
MKSLVVVVGVGVVVVVVVVVGMVVVVVVVVVGVGVGVGVGVDAINDTAAGIFSFFMHLVALICSSISHMIARLLVDSIESVEDIVFDAQFCS